MASINASSPSPELSIIIISFNTKEVTKNCIESIYTSFSNNDLSFFEIVVIDNDSKDGSVEMVQDLQKKYSNIVLEANTENIGFGRANNQGVKAAKGKYILLLNSDTLVLENAIEKLFHFYEENEQTIHFLGGKLFNKDMTPQPSAARFFTVPVVFAVMFLRGDYWGFTRSSPDTFCKTDWISGACIMTKKNIYEKVGGFDEQIFMYMEEVDLLYRAKKQGFNTFFYPEAQFIHLGSVSSGGKTYPILQVYRGFFYFYKKHYSPLANVLLKVMLQLKALISWGIGKLTHNQYLIQTYEQAYKIASMD